MIKIDVITGFLGAGKTTYIQRQIEEGVFENEKVVILENEYGEVNLDSSLLMHNNVPIYEITKGCICCSLKGDFVSALSEIHETLHPDRVLIEPSGIFMMEALYELLKDESLAENYTVNSITSIVDVTLFHGGFMPMEGFIASQIKWASQVVFSKISEAKAGEYERARAFVKEIKSDAVMSDDFISHQTYESITIEISESILESTFIKFLDSVENGLYGDIIRMKGILMIDGDWQEVHYVNGKTNRKNSSLKAPCALVIIGTHLDREKIGYGLWI